ncbi:MAG: 1-(5-phosphoribosyl)-5-[(5-phosphoribosylamino)methylideneamino]imidazole-4-carboxamide isomerase [Eubacteriaceae bacterium]|jgi:phosphoribosylformimino-5-aminoimidazole carboxamide ribotide isomerase|nr:1-(5-phosphoribosyl)-5-[(5-phosphoribosylamino)methylideneamino]imidazole-4-carboxamide isomerase [Eubacteriaceae bacterium]
MIILPAIDIKNQKCVRLSQGKKDQETIYFDDPVAVAKDLEEKGAEYLHIIDLDGAFDGLPVNLKLISDMVQSVNIPVQVGGGIRNMETADAYIDIGVGRIIIGTQAVENTPFIEQLIHRYDEQICVSLDANHGMVAVKGWVETSAVEALALATKLERLGLSTLVYTDISKDGMLTGPNFQMLDLLNRSLNMNIIAAGGVATEAHLDQLEDMGIYGAITGKAIYEGTLDLKAYLDRKREENVG